MESLKAELQAERDVRLAEREAANNTQAQMDIQRQQLLRNDSSLALKASEVETLKPELAAKVTQATLRANRNNACDEYGS